MRHGNHQKHISGPRVKLWGRPQRLLGEKDIERLQRAASGHNPYVVNARWRELVEQKSRFIPKIWEDIE